jgi:hypothetical protein
MVYRPFALLWYRSKKMLQSAEHYLPWMEAQQCIDFSLKPIGKWSLGKL